MILSNMRITKALISLRVCAGWSAPLMFANLWRQVFSRGGPFNREKARGDKGEMVAYAPKFHPKWDTGRSGTLPKKNFFLGRLIFSSPEPKAPRWAISIPVTLASVVRPSVRRPSVRQHFQTSSPLKPLGQLNSNFIWRLLRMGERKFIQMVLVTWPRWPPCPYMVKTL